MSWEQHHKEKVDELQIYQVPILEIEGDVFSQDNAPSMPAHQEGNVYDSFWSMALST